MSFPNKQKDSNKTNPLLEHDSSLCSSKGFIFSIFFYYFQGFIIFKVYLFAILLEKNRDLCFHGLFISAFYCIVGRPHALYSGSSDVKKPLLKIRGEVRLCGLWKAKHQVSSSETQQGYLWDGHIFLKTDKTRPRVKEKSLALGSHGMEDMTRINMWGTDLSSSSAGVCQFGSIAPGLPVPCRARHSHPNHELSSSRCPGSAKERAFQLSGKDGGPPPHCGTTYSLEMKRDGDHQLVPTGGLTRLQGTLPSQ